MSVAMGKGLKAKSLAISPDRRLVAVGLTNGGIKVLERTEKGMDQVFWAKHCVGSIDEMKFSPDGAFLAVGSHDQARYFLIFLFPEFFSSTCCVNGHVEESSEIQISMGAILDSV